MKIVHFDADKITADYLNKHPINDAQTIITSEGIDRLSKETYDQVKDADVITVFVHTETRMDEHTLGKFPNLKLLCTRSSGYDHIDMDYCTSRGIVVCRVPRYGEATVAEFAAGLLLNVTRKIYHARNDMRNGNVRMNDYLGFDLCGKTIGIIGFGAIGKHMGKIAQGFGMKVVAYDLYQDTEYAKKNNIEYATLNELFAKSDVISLHAPSTKENYHLINEESFAKMKDGVVIINTGRGDLIDSEALYKAIASGKVYGAGLDVLENEDFIIHDDIILKDKAVTMDYAINTIANNKLIHHRDVIVTPHAAFNSIDAVHRILDTTLENIRGFMSGVINNCIIKEPIHINYVDVTTTVK